ncbi:salicylate synthase [Pseudonocardia endophytica]|uniref:Anthranilate synthase component 1/salicylate synthetase n=1 Tax=Pseudonocardia endophytica TaxID=401976 RepID=A0A4V2PIR9_PSEEN|nr:salicylate synthase [Pseudonocardia endophytica]TCK25716.1 anthranilate synthase component 1/salicylate synthetase [Pseudonocardia endophytica]
MSTTGTLGYREETVHGRFDPVTTGARLAASGLFESHVVYEREGRCTFAGGALGEVTVHDDRVRTRWRDAVTELPRTDRPLRQVGDALAALPWPGWNAYGWVEFELADPDPNGRAVGCRPGLHLTVPHTEVVIRPDRVRVRSADPERSAAVRGLLAGTDAPEPAAAEPIAVDGDARSYQDAVARAVEEIRRGALQKVILSRSVPVPFPVDLVGTYLRGRAANTPARSFLIDLGGRRAVGFSPETVVEVAPDGRVETQPLAGTRAFGLGHGADERLTTELLSDPKEVFEHAVSVKLAYDELHAVCAPGSVAVTELMAVRRRGSVQHLASRVAGRLAATRTAWDALAAVFPAVTASGIPKAAAYECIRRWESQPRGLYAGAVLTASHDGSLDACLVLRTLFEEDGRAWLRAGAGVVAGSVPEREYEETCEKLRSIAPHVVPSPRAETRI